MAMIRSLIHSGRCWLTLFLVQQNPAAGSYWHAFWNALPVHQRTERERTASVRRQHFNKAKERWIQQKLEDWKRGTKAYQQLIMHHTMSTADQPSMQPDWLQQSPANSRLAISKRRSASYAPTTHWRLTLRRRWRCLKQNIQGPQMITDHHVLQTVSAVFTCCKSPATMYVERCHHFQQARLEVRMSHTSASSRSTDHSNRRQSGTGDSGLGERDAGWFVQSWDQQDHFRRKADSAV